MRKIDQRKEAEERRADSACFFFKDSVEPRRRGIDNGR